MTIESQSFEFKPASYSLATEFGMNVPVESTIEGFQPGHYAVPEKSDYVFMRHKLRDMLAFWESGLNALKIYGDPGTGKDSIIEQFHARLNWPLYKVSCAPTTQAYQLTGQMLPDINGTIRWVDGPVLRAAREGSSVLLSEYNVMDSGETTGLNLLLEGYAITIPETGEVVRPKKGFRVFATENPVNSRLSVAGRNVQDVANDDRWMVTEADYLPEELETPYIAKELVKIGTPSEQADMLASQIVKIANRVRQAYRSGDPNIDKPMSTRVAIRWAKLFRRFRNVSQTEGGPMLYSLTRAFSMGPDMSDAVKEFTRTVTGTGG